MQFSIKYFFSKFDQIPSFLQIWSHLLKKSLTENFAFCAVTETKQKKNQENHVLNWYENLPSSKAGVRKTIEKNKKFFDHHGK